jgi:AAA domain
MSKRIVSFSARDVLRLSAVEITPSGDVVVLGGDNAAGKTSVLDAIQMALAGKRYTPEEPIHRGSDRAHVVLDLGDIIVERIITASSDRLMVKSRAGAVYPRPQEMLNRLFTAISFDPLKFASQPPADQAEILKQITGLNFAKLDADRAALYVQRTDVGRDAARLKARAEGMPRHPDAPAAETSVAALATELTRRQAQARQADRLRRGVRDAIAGVERLIAEQTVAARKVADLEADLAAARNGLIAAIALVEREKAAAREVKASADAFEVEDAGEIESQLATAEELNRAVRENADRIHAETEATLMGETVKHLTKEIEAIDAAKTKALSEVRFPVPGLSLSDGGVTFKGLPFSQASTAEKIRVSLAIGIALNPELRVLFVRDGSLLDKHGLQLVADLAAENDCQIWLEDSRSTDPTAIIIEDGRVKGQESAEPNNEAHGGLTLVPHGA